MYSYSYTTLLYNFALHRCGVKVPMRRAMAVRVHLRRDLQMNQCRLESLLVRQPTVRRLE